MALRNFATSDFGASFDLTLLEPGTTTSTADTLRSLVADVPAQRLGSLLLLAAWRGAARCVQLLLDAGADANAVDASGRSALHLAAINGNVSVCRLLLANGAKPNSFDRHHLATPLFCAAVNEKNAEEVIR